MNYIFFGGLVVVVATLFDMTKRIDRLQKQVEHLHNVMLGEFERRK